MLQNSHMDRAEGRRQKAEIRKKAKEGRNKGGFGLTSALTYFFKYLSLRTNFCLLPSALLP
jgi:hypothetical protein